MKKIIALFATIFITVHVLAQAPQTMSYQAIIRNSSNALVVNTQVRMRISILQATASGTSVYVETQTPTTNANGLLSFGIGSGTIVSGTFSTIDWSAGPYFIKTETDPTGGTNYTISGTSQLMSVPFALYAASSGNAGVPYTGATTSVDLGAHDLTVNGMTVGLGSNQIYNNTAIGNLALQGNTTGGANTANGFNSLQRNTIGNGNTANGFASLSSNISGLYNTASGINSLLNNTTGSNNTAMGDASLYNNNGNDNTAIGRYSLLTNNNGASNTALGEYSLQRNTVGSANTSIGKNTLYSNITGSSITAIGYNSDVALDGLHNATAIGANAIVDANNKIQLGDSNVTNVNTSGTITAPKIGVGTNSPNSSAALDVTSTVQGFLPPRMTGAQRDAIANPAQGLMLYCTNCGTKGEPEYYDGTTWVNLIGGFAAPGPIGSIYQGGIIFYILQPSDSGYVAGQTHGLIAATTNPAHIQWCNGCSYDGGISVGITGTAIGTGLNNTNIIITSQGATSTNYAAGFARAYTGGGYTDWYLPSSDELNKLNLNNIYVPDFHPPYWSSSEATYKSAYVLSGLNGQIVIYETYKNGSCFVRPIRSF